MEPSGLHALRNGTESRENKKESLQRTGRSTGEESYTERDPDDLQRHTLSFQQSSSQHMLVKNNLRLRKEVSKMVRRNSSWCPHRARNSACSYSQTGNTQENLPH